ALAFEAKEAVVHRVAEPARRRLGEVQDVLREERAGQLEILAPHTVAHETLELAHRRAQHEMRVLVRQRADPDLEDLAPPRHADRRSLPFAAVWERLEIRIVAVVQPANLADHLKQTARRVAVLAEPRDRDR